MTLPSPPVPFGNPYFCYLGKAGAMQKLRMPDSPYQSIATRADQIQVLLSGGTVVTRAPKTKRAWVLPFSGMTQDTANILVAFYGGTMGVGPYIFIDPAWRNVFGMDVSSMGAVISAISGWTSAVTATQTLTYDTTVVAQFVESGVMRWTGAGSASKIGVGTWSPSLLVPDASAAPVYLSDQPCAGSIYARTASSTASVTLNWNGEDAAGNIQLAGSSATATLNSTGWTRLTSYLASGNAAALYALPTITCNTASAPPIQFCCADLQYGPTAANGLLAAWILGLGSPRIVITPGTSGTAGFTTTSRLLPYRDHGLTFSEV